MIKMPFTLADRATSLSSFKVMDVMQAAQELEQQGRNIIHMEVGEPRFELPAPLLKAAHQALEKHSLGYTSACGIKPLREAIADYYWQHHQLHISPERIIVTTGSSAALGLLCDLLFNPGDGVMLTDPGYPCNPNFLRRSQLYTQLIPVTADTHFQLTETLVQEHWRENTRGVIIASPANPTGEIIDDGELAAICRFVASHNGALISDELYHGLTYSTNPPATALAYSEHAFVINGFSKYYGLTGWRLGWLVAPEFCVERLTAMIQNFYISSPTLSQYVALAALDSKNQTIFQQRRDEFRERRDYLANALRELGFGISHIPEGAFYLYTDISAFSDDCEIFCNNLLFEHGVACTPGTDFGQNRARQYVRFSYTEPLARLEQAVECLGKALEK